MNPNGIHALMAEIQSELAELRTLDDRSWDLVVDEDTTIRAAHDGDAGRLLLSAEVAATPAATRLATYDLLLTYTNQWQDTGGICMGLDDATGRVVQSVDIGTDGLDGPALAVAVADFHVKLLAWRIMVSRGVRDVQDPAVPPADLDPRFDPGMIRI